MPQITNTTEGALGVHPDHTVPANGTIDVPAEAWALAKLSPVVQAWVKDGWIVPARKADDAKPVSPAAA